MVQFSHTLDLLFDILDEVRFLGELLLVDALDGVHLILCGFEFYLLDGEDEGEGSLAQSPHGVEVVALEDLPALLHCLLLLHHYRIIRKLGPSPFTRTRLFSVFQHYKLGQTTAKNRWPLSASKWSVMLGWITWEGGSLTFMTGKIEKTDGMLTLREKWKTGGGRLWIHWGDLGLTWGDETKVDSVDIDGLSTKRKLPIEIKLLRIILAAETFWKHIETFSKTISYYFYTILE